MKNKRSLPLYCILLFAAIALHFVVGNKVVAGNKAVLQNAEPWKPSQLLAPADLAKSMNDIDGKQPFVFCIGPGAHIKGSIDIGPARDSVNLNKFRQALGKFPKDATIVIYCGCCPFEHCPNIRPAFRLLNEMKFANARLLNLEHNLKVDWIDKGYPVAN